MMTETDKVHAPDDKVRAPDDKVRAPDDKVRAPDDKVLTPDFYDYPWAPPSTVGVDGHFVCMRWADGTELRAFDLWLRENAVGAGGIDVSTRECVLDPAEHVDDMQVVDASIEPDGSVRCVFEPGSVVARYHPGWLRHVADGEHLPGSHLPEQSMWTTADLDEPPTHDGRHALDDPDVLRRWVDDLLRFGIGRLRGLPTDPDLGVELGARIGALRDTNFGPIWDVVADTPLDGASDTNSTANTRVRLAPHTDLPTRETPPGFQFLHCVENSTTGGHSTMADGAAVVEHLRTAHPSEYEALTTLRWVFFNRGRGLDHRWSGPIIDLGVTGSPLTLRAFYPVRAFPDMDEADMPRAYDALKLFARLAADDRFQLRYPFEPGDLVGFDNRRILHGRDAYTSGGRRHLRGFYMDHDEVRSFARVARRGTSR